MPLETTLIYSEPLLRHAAFCFWRRTVGAGSLIAIVILIAGLALRLASRDTSWFTGALATVLLFLLLFVVSIYLVHYRNVMAKFRAMGSPQATLSAGQDSFTVTSPLGSSTLVWSTVTELWRFDRVWLLLFSKAQFMTLPAACLSPELQALILDRVRAAGGKV